MVSPLVPAKCPQSPFSVFYPLSSPLLDLMRHLVTPLTTAPKHSYLLLYVMHSLPHSAALVASFSLIRNGILQVKE